jgi:hypothetical protein
MTEKEEQAYIRGEHFAYRAMLSECLRNLPAADRNKDSWRIERADAVAALRRLCEHHGDNDWPDDLNLADVINKHLNLD